MYRRRKTTPTRFVIPICIIRLRIKGLRPRVFGRNVVRDPRLLTFRPPAHLDRVWTGVTPAEGPRIVPVDLVRLAEEKHYLSRCHPVVCRLKLADTSRGDLGVRRRLARLARLTERSGRDSEGGHGQQKRDACQRLRHNPWMMTRCASAWTSGRRAQASVSPSSARAASRSDG